MLTKLILIRHGITDWNKARRYCGRIDVTLSRQGKIQAKRLSKTMGTMSCDKIYTSNQKRAIETANIVFGKAPLAKVKELRELNFGIFEGLRHKDIVKKYPEAYRRWIADPFHYAIPHGENLNAFRTRAVGALQKIVRKHPRKTIAVVCHGGTIAIYITTILKKKNFWNFVPKTASVSMVEFRNNKPKLKLFNETKHLR